MTQGELFAGIGGFGLAGRWAGIESVFQVEWNEYCQKILRKNFPNAQIFGDIKQFDGTQFRGAIDIISGGFPCQPYSTAGKRLGKEDERHLWPEMLRVIREVAPRWVVGENVFGLVNWSGGLVFDEVQSDLEASGYEVQAFVLPAASTNAPHIRQRVWFVAHTDTSRLSQSVCAKLECAKFQEKPFKGGEPGRRDTETGRSWRITQSPVRGRNDGVSTELDENINIEYYDKSGNKKSISTRNSLKREILREMWEQSQSTTPSLGLQQRRSDCFMSEMPYIYTHERWQLGQRIEEEKELQDMWKRVCSMPLEKTQHLQQRLLIRVREIECNEAVAKNRMGRIAALGNAIVPQVAYRIFDTIRQYEALQMSP